jgi:hypothetical protein
MDEEKRDAPEGAPKPAGQSPQAPPGEMSREERIAAARAKAEELKAQRAAGAAPPAGAPARAATAGAGTPAATAGAAPQPQKPLATSDNPGAQPVVAPQNPTIRAFGTISQSVELTCEATEDQNIRRLLGGLGAYRNPLRGVWQIDYRYYAEAVTRLRAAGYQVEGTDYLGRPLEKWTPETRGWSRLPPR